MNYPSTELRSIDSVIPTPVLTVIPACLVTSGDSPRRESFFKERAWTSQDDRELEGLPTDRRQSRDKSGSDRGRSSGRHYYLGVNK